MPHHTQEQKQVPNVTLPTSFSPDAVAAKEKGTFLGRPIAAIVASYVSDEKYLPSIILKTQGFFPPVVGIEELMQLVILGDQDAVVSISSKYPGLLLQSLPEFTVPCGDVLFDVNPLLVMMFYQDWHMLNAVKSIITDGPKTFITAVNAECDKMRGGGADLVKMTQDPRTVDLTQDVHGYITYPLLQNSNGLVLYNNKLFYVTQSQFVMELDERSIPVDKQEELRVFKANFNEMEDNTGKRSNNREHELIRRILGIILERGGIRYQREGIMYQDTQLGMGLGTAYRRYIRLCKTREPGTSKDSVNRAWLAIGGKQRQSILMLQWMCEEIRFDPLPENRLRQGPFKRTLKFTNLNLEFKKENLAIPFSSTEGLGVDLTLYKGLEAACGSTLPCSPAWDDLIGYCGIMKVGKACITEFSEDIQALAISRHCASLG